MLFDKELKELLILYPDPIIATFMCACIQAFEEINNTEKCLVDPKELILQAIGQASMCWSRIEKAGIFDNDQAKAIGMKLLKDLGFDKS